MGNVSIYCLKDPLDSSIRYVGVTKFPIQQRLAGHIREKGRAYKCRWVQKLLSEGRAPVIEILETAHKRDWQTAEIRWISKMRGKGAKLTNTTAGGFGLLDVKHSEETKRKMSQSGKGKHSNYVPTLETRKKISMALKGTVCERS